MTAMICPTCFEEMSEETHRGVRLDLCSAYPGVWFDWGELEDYNHAEGEADIPGIPGLKEFEPTGDSTHVKCPRCESDFLRTGTIGKHKVIRCTTCSGFFLPLSDQGSNSEARLKILGSAFQIFKDMVSGLI